MLSRETLTPELGRKAGAYRVRLSAHGEAQFPNMPRWRQGWALDHKRNLDIAYVHWDGLKQSHTMAKSFIECINA